MDNITSHPRNLQLGNNDWNVSQYLTICCDQFIIIEVFYGHEINNQRLRYFSRLIKPDHHDHPLSLVTVCPRDSCLVS